MKSIKRSLIRLFAAASVGMLLAACGQENTTASNNGGSSNSSSQSSEQLTPDRSITVTANDQMKFNVTEIQASPGEVLEVTLDNVGTMPKFSMGHNFVVIDKGTDLQQFAEAAMNEAANDYLPKNMQGQIVAATELLGGGEADTIVFRVPSAPGEYPFLCTFPGHFQVGMRGTLVVR